MRFCALLPFFKFIKVYFGLRTLRTLEKFISLLKLRTALRIRIYFLRTCIKLQLTPSHLDSFRKYGHLRLFERSSRKSLENIYNKHVIAVLRLELPDAFKHLRTTRTHIFNISKSISYLLPPVIGNAFFTRQEVNDYHCFHHLRFRIDKKIESFVVVR